MATLSITKLLAMRGRFAGRIAQIHAAHTQFVGLPPVLIPETIADVQRAVTLAKAAGARVFFRSGGRVAAKDIEPEPNAAVISLETLAGVKVDLERVTVGPAATVGDVATALRNRALFLPLPDQPTMSIVSAVGPQRRSPFPRSGGPTLLRDGVIEADVIRTGGDQASEVQTLNGDDWRALQASGEGIVTRLVIDASLWRSAGKNRWIRAWMIPYAATTFGPLCDELFGGAVPAGVDLGLRASSGAFGARVVLVRATGLERDLSEQTRFFVEEALKKTQCLVLWSEHIEGAGAALAAWVGTGPGTAREDEVNTIVSNDHAWSPGNEATFLTEADALIRAGAWVNLLMDTALRRTFVSEVAAPVAAPAQPPVVAALAAVAPAASLLAPTNIGGPIPGFGGEVFELAVDDNPYKDATGKQYAVSSLDAATIARRMRPLLVAVPHHSADVVTAVRWAAERGLKVVARSGGHQYCGLSSGGADTLLIDVGGFNTVAPSADRTRVTVGPGVELQVLSKKLVELNLSIPHGECPLVNLGGHVQTGGVGHQLRSLGATLDWVRSFKMVGWDANGGWAERVFDRPDPNNPQPGDEVFAAVLGGGPGSWGVLTEITFKTVADANPQNPPTRGYTRTYPYNRAGWAAAFDQMRVWSEREHAGSLPGGVDYFLSVISSDFELLPDANVRPAVLLVETTALSTVHEPEIVAVVKAVESNVSWIDKIAGKVIDLAHGDANGAMNLSSIVHKGVRSTGSLGGMPGGREFGLPYKKSLYVTRDPLPAAFCEGFVDLVDRANRTRDVKVVFQGVIGGGSFQDNAVLKTTQMQHRDALVQVVFDVFYRPGHADVAEGLQDEMRALWDAHLGDETWRMFWGTYEDKGTDGAQLDMRNADTRSRYYDSPATYAALQRVKARVDPTDVFHTSFTVQLP